MPDMYVVTVTLEGPSQSQLLFFRKDKAIEAYEALTAEGVQTIKVMDDYGTRLMITAASILAVQCSDFNKQSEGASEVQMNAQINQAKLQRKIQESPTLRLLAPGSPMAGMARG